MKRQLYYLVPDIEHTKDLCHDLENINISKDRIHAVMKEKNLDLDKCCDVHSITETDHDSVVEYFCWFLIISLFFFSLVIFISMVIWQPSFYIIMPSIVMLACLTASSYFILNVPSVHWQEFKNAIPHGEILFIVDVPKKALHYVDKVIHRMHPEALLGGVCWKM